MNTLTCMKRAGGGGIKKLSNRPHFSVCFHNRVFQLHIFPLENEFVNMYQ